LPETEKHIGRDAYETAERRQKMRRILVALSLSSILVLSLGAGTVAASGVAPNLALNGDFETGDLSQWTLFETANGVFVREGVEVFQTADSLPPSRAALLRVGHKVWEEGSEHGWEGGGIAQTFTAPAGAWEVSANIAAILPIKYVPGTYIPFPAFRAGKFELVVDGVVVDSIVLPNVDGFTAYQGMLSATGSFTESGPHEISIKVTVDTYLAHKHYVDDIRLAMTSINAQIDIKPGDDLNSINLGSNGVVPVAILGSATFDASTVAPSTVSIAGAPARPKGKSENYGSLQDVNGDGYPDLVVQVHTRDLGLTAASTTASLTALTFSGIPVFGSDSVNIVKPKDGKNH
jgi:hypothetical protein